jgi:hypothetical protein
VYNLNPALTQTVGIVCELPHISYIDIRAFATLKKVVYVMRHDN